MLKTSTKISSSAKIVGEEKAIEYIAKAGFDAWDFSMFAMADYNFKYKKVISADHPLRGNDYLKFARKLKQTGTDNGIICNQSHAPFPSSDPEVFSFLKRVLTRQAETYV